MSEYLRRRTQLPRQDGICASWEHGESIKGYTIVSCYLSKEDEVLVGKIYGVINKIAEEKGFKEQGFRVIVNSGEDGGQEVMHLHFHILAGKQLGEKIV